MKGENPSREHHVLPRAYLKGFTDPNHEHSVWVYRRGAPFQPVRAPHADKSPHLQPIRSAGRTRDYYAFETLSGEMAYDRVDTGLKVQEDRALGILRAIRAKRPIDAGAKASFSAYIRMMLMRVPHREKWAEPAFDKALDSFPWDDLARRAAEEGRFREARLLTHDRNQSRRRLKRELMLRSLVEPAAQPEVAPVDKTIRTMTWHFFVAPSDRFFVTTDNPVLFSPPPLGLRDAKSWLVFPISSGVALFARLLHPADRVYADATPAQADFLNRLILSGADDLTYACRQQRWVVDAWANPPSEAEVARITEVMQPPGWTPTNESP